jgi:hypothetical protein
MDAGSIRLNYQVLSLEGMLVYILMNKRVFSAELTYNAG